MGTTGKSKKGKGKKAKKKGTKGMGDTSGFQDE